jgi:hypothetical protein
MIVYSSDILARSSPSTNSFTHPSIQHVQTTTNNLQDNNSKWFNYLLYSFSLFLPWQSAPSLLLSTATPLRPSFILVPMPSELHRACPLYLLPSDLPVCLSSFTTGSQTYNSAAKVKRSSLPNDENASARYVVYPPLTTLTR